jgi:hypothetical protein
LGRQERHHPVFIEERRPGAVVFPGIDNEEGYYEDDALTIEEGYEEQATIAQHEESTVNIIARVVDTAEENRMRREQGRMRHELDQLRQMVDNTVAIKPVVATHRYVENGDEEVHANHGDLPRSAEPKCGTRGRRWYAIGVILLIVVAVAVALALVLPSEPTMPTQAPNTTTPIPQDLSELISSASSDGGAALATPSTPQYKALEWLAGNPNLANYTYQQVIQRYALATLYYSTKGDSWASNDFWLSNADVCGKWNQYNGTTIDCTSTGAVSSLDLPSNGLRGTIPPEIGMLSDSVGKLVVKENAVQLCVILSHG